MIKPPGTPGLENPSGFFFDQKPKRTPMAFEGTPAPNERDRGKERAAVGWDGQRFGRDLEMPTGAVQSLSHSTPPTTPPTTPHQPPHTNHPTPTTPHQPPHTTNHPTPPTTPPHQPPPPTCFSTMSTAYKIFSRPQLTGPHKKLTNC